MWESVFYVVVILLVFFRTEMFESLMLLIHGPATTKVRIGVQGSRDDGDDPEHEHGIHQAIRKITDQFYPDVLADGPFSATAISWEDWQALLCEVDSLMQEYCPQEMVDSQWEEWGNHQRPVDYLKGQIDAAIKAQHPNPSK